MVDFEKTYLYLVLNNVQFILIQSWELLNVWNKLTHSHFILRKFLIFGQIHEFS